MQPSFDPSEQAALSSPKQWVGRTLGHYRITAVLGQGGMGVVYRAYDRSRRRSVALKLLPNSVAGSVTTQEIRRLLREARSTRRLNHPNIVTFLDAGQSDGVCFLVMELVSAGSAQDFLTAEGPFAWPMATWIISQACRGLVKAHAAGIVHRDVKPSNILLGREGEVKLADFGLAKTADQSTLSSTGTGKVLGTPNFMAPEQCRAEEADEGSDVYSLGATYYALLTGKPPYPLGVPVQVMFAHCSRPVPDPRTIVADIPEQCAYVVTRAMAKRRDQRYPSAKALLADLEQILTTVRGPTRRPRFRLREDKRTPEEIESQTGLLRNRVVLGVGAVMMLLLLAGGMFVAFRPAQSDSAYQREESLNGAFLEKGVMKRVLPTKGAVTGVAWSPDQTQLAVSGNGVSLWNGSAQEPSRVLWGNKRMYSVAFSPDGRMLAAGGDGKIHVWWPSDGRETTWVVSESGNRVAGLAWDTKGTRLAARFDRRSPEVSPVAVWDSVAGKLAYRLSVSAGRVHSVVFAADVLATSGEYGVVQLWDPITGVTRNKLATGFASAYGLAVSSRGILAVSGYSRGVGPGHGIQLWETATRKRRTPTLLATPRLWALSFSPRGRVLAAGAMSQVTLFDVETGREIRTIGEASKQQSCGQSFSPDGKMLAMGLAPSGVLLVDVSTDCD